MKAAIIIFHCNISLVLYLISPKNEYAVSKSELIKKNNYICRFTLLNTRR